MARQTKTKTTENASSESVVPQVSVAQTASPSAVSEPKVKKTKASKADKQELVSSVPDVQVQSTETVEAAASHVDADVEAPLTEQSIELLAKLQQLGSLISAIKVEYRTLEKKWMRELKVAQKQSSKRKRKAGNRAPSGFVKPTRISDELAKFLEKPAGCEMARTEVTRDINKYIRTNNLQDKSNGRKINPDKKLSTLLKLKNTDELTYFNLQKFMSPHFAKASKTESQSAPAL
jgi:chromatin remodeling complex protein RSC6